MPQADAKGADGRGAKTLSVVDFRAGIVTAASIYGAPFVRVNTIGSPLSLSQVTAGPNTYNCVAMGNGGLAPLPQPQLWNLPTTGFSGSYYNGTTGFPNQLLAGLLYCEAIFGQQSGSGQPIETPKSIIAAVRTQSPGTGYPLSPLRIQPHNRPMVENLRRWPMATQHRQCRPPLPDVPIRNLFPEHLFPVLG